MIDLDRQAIVDLVPAGGSLDLLSVAGSTAYGTNHVGSDLDMRGIYTLPSAAFLGTSEPTLGVDVLEPYDVNLKELATALKLAAGGNPHALEMLFVEPEGVLATNGRGEAIRSARKEFLTLKAVHAYAGYFTGQVNYLAAMDPDHCRFRKTKGHIVRLRLAFIHLVDEHDILVKLGDAERDEVMNFPDSVTTEDFLAWAFFWVELVEKMKRDMSAKFPTHVSPTWLDTFCVGLRDI